MRILHSQFSGKTLRLLAKDDSGMVQVNIFNPADDGHSFAFMYPADDSSDLQKVFEDLTASDLIATQMEKAESAFALSVEPSGENPMV